MLLWAKEISTSKILKWHKNSPAKGICGKCLRVWGLPDPPAPFLKLQTPWPHVSVHIETTDSIFSCAGAYWNYGLHGLMCLCILKLRTPYSHVPVHIETTDSMASCACAYWTTDSMASCVCAYWNYGLHFLICLCILKLRTPRPQLSVILNYGLLGLTAHVHWN